MLYVGIVSNDLSSIYGYHKNYAIHAKKNLNEWLPTLWIRISGLKMLEVCFFTKNNIKYIVKIAFDGFELCRFAEALFFELKIELE